LRDFPVLKKLGCPAETLNAQWDSEERMWVENLWYGGGIHERLPASLETLRFYIYDYWSIDEWGMDFLSLFERKFWKLPTLREIWVAYRVAGDGLMVICCRVIYKLSRAGSRT
jgi:hypothetical protein